MLLFLCEALWLILRGDLLFFSPFSIAVISLWEERAGLCAFRAFVCFARDGLCLFPFPVGASDWMRLVIVALPGLFFLRFADKIF